jgi:hypothetical protein
MPVKAANISSLSIAKRGFGQRSIRRWIWLNTERGLRVMDGVNTIRESEWIT